MEAAELLDDLLAYPMYCGCVRDALTRRSGLLDMRYMLEMFSSSSIARFTSSGSLQAISSSSPSGVGSSSAPELVGGTSKRIGSNLFPAISARSVNCRTSGWRPPTAAHLIESLPG